MKMAVAGGVFIVALAGTMETGTACYKDVLGITSICTRQRGIFLTLTNKNQFV